MALALGALALLSATKNFVLSRFARGLQEAIRLAHPPKAARNFVPGNSLSTDVVANRHILTRTDGLIAIKKFILKSPHTP